MPYFFRVYKFHIPIVYHRQQSIINHVPLQLEYSIDRFVLCVTKVSSDDRIFSFVTLLPRSFNSSWGTMDRSNPYWTLQNLGEIPRVGHIPAPSLSDIVHQGLLNKIDHY